MSQTPAPVDLSDRFREGDKLAFEQLHRLYSNLLHGWLCSHCFGVVSADDVAQATWVSAWTKRSQFKGGNFRAWLFRIAINVKNDSARDCQRSTTVDFQDAGDAVHQMSLAAFTTTADRTMLDDQIAMLRHCLESVGGEFVQVLRMAIMDDLSPLQIAERLQLGSVNTVYSRSSRGRDAIRDCMERNG